MEDDNNKIELTEQLRPGVSPLMRAVEHRLSADLLGPERLLLRPLTHHLVGNYARVPTEHERWYSLIDSTYRIVVPLGITAAGWPDIAEQLRWIAPINSALDAEAAGLICLEISGEAEGRLAAVRKEGVREFGRTRPHDPEMWAAACLEALYALTHASRLLQDIDVAEFTIVLAERVCDAFMFAAQAAAAASAKRYASEDELHARALASAHASMRCSLDVREYVWTAEAIARRDDLRRLEARRPIISAVLEAFSAACSLGMRD